MTKLLKLSLFFNAFLLILGLLFVIEQLSQSRYRPLWHYGTSIPEHYDSPVVYYNIEYDPIRIVVTYAYVDKNNVWRKWEGPSEWTQVDPRLPPPMWWTEDPTAAR